MQKYKLNAQTILYQKNTKANHQFKKTLKFHHHHHYHHHHHHQIINIQKLHQYINIFKLNATESQNDKEEEEEFERRLARLKIEKGETPYGQGKKRAKTKGEKEIKPVIDYSNEVLYYEGTPHRGDLIVNLFLIVTIVWLPLTIAAISRAAFFKYKITDKRVSVEKTAPWQQERVDVTYPEIRNVVAIGRGIGAWGDMVITLMNGNKVELRSIPNWLENKNYIESQCQQVKDKETVEESSKGFI